MMANGDGGRMAMEAQCRDVRGERKIRVSAYWSLGKVANKVFIYAKEKSEFRKYKI